MGDLPLPVTADPVLFGEVASLPRDSVSPASTETNRHLALLDVLREAVAVGTQSTDSILESIAEAAGVLTGANGIAIALRQEGVIICRARSGDIAPELGSPLNADSGISGECLRAAAILVCSDTATDKRVDSEVCERLGVKSIVAVPLRGRTGMVGILEAFSARTGTFEKEQIEALRALGEIAERAYERERRRLEPVVQVKGRTGLVSQFAGLTSQLAKSDQSQSAEEEIPLKRGYWIIGAVAATVLLVSLVIGLSWRQTSADIAAHEPAAQAKSATAQTVPYETPPLAANRVATNPAPAIPTRESDRSTASLIHKAAEHSSEIDPPKASVSTTDAPPTNTSPAPAGTDATDESAAPTVDLTPSSAPSDLPNMASTAAMPTFGGNVSQGMTEATLIRRVDPLYPAQAREKRLAGPVTVEATIGENGSVRTVKVVSGPALLADSAADAVRQWRYKPATLNGKAIEAQKQITVVFKLP
jgi:protein TonB